MSKVRLLDCTLRDGGYVNDWCFGEEVISDILDKMLKSNVDIVEAGFIRDETYDKERAVFPNLKALDGLLARHGIKKGTTKLAVMAEISNPIPLEKIEEASTTGIDIVRVIVWKTKHNVDGQVVDALQEGYEYCKGIINKGYKLCVQPNRSDQYTDDEFKAMIKLFAELNPYAIYVVDSWGTMYANKVLHYMEMADSMLAKTIAIGFHGHNNMMQAFSTAERIVERNFSRNIILDASVAGIGRGAGNLNLELIARYLNHEYQYDYRLEPMYKVYDCYIKSLRKKYTWGSTLPFMLSADYNANPNYASSFSDSMSLLEMDAAYSHMSNDDRIIYTAALAKKYKSIAFNDKKE